MPRAPGARSRPPPAATSCPTPTPTRVRASSSRAPAARACPPHPTPARGPSLVVTSTGRVCVNYVGTTGSAVRVTCRTTAGTWTADPLPANIFTHTPQLYSRNDDLYVFLGHDVDINYGYTYHLAGQPWGPYTKLLLEAHDGSASTRWDPRRDNNPNVIDTAFFDEDILKTRTWVPEIYYMAVLHHQLGSRRQPRGHFKPPGGPLTVRARPFNHKEDYGI